jgi:phosphoribosylformylglycinamidine cyclo-ligase
MIDNATQSVLDVIDNSNLSVDNSLVKTTGTPNYFASVIDVGHYIAHCTDGVGSKIKHLIKHEMYSDIGKDAFAMNYNDILCVGANAVSFQDHITSTNSDAHIIPKVVEGIVEYCGETFTLLSGGETEILKDTHFHVSGSLMGIVQKDNLIDGTKVQDGDVIIGLESSGIHSNGWTAIEDRVPELILPETLTATKLYNNDINLLTTQLENVSAIVNITGGGFRNLERIPNNFMYDIYHESPSRTWEILETKFTHQELYTTFNMGIGMMVIVRPEIVDRALGALLSNPKVIGKVKDFHCPKVMVNGQEIHFGDTEPYVFEEEVVYNCDINLTDN